MNKIQIFIIRLLFMGIMFIGGIIYVGFTIQDRKINKLEQRITVLEKQLREIK